MDGGCNRGFVKSDGIICHVTSVKHCCDTDACYIDEALDCDHKWRTWYAALGSPDRPMDWRCTSPMDNVAVKTSRYRSIFL